MTNVMPDPTIGEPLYETVKDRMGDRLLSEDEFYVLYRRALIHKYETEGPDLISEKEIMLLQALSIQDISRKIDSIGLDSIADVLGDISETLDRKLKGKGER